MRLIDADILIEKLKSYAECDWNKSLCAMLPSVVDDCIEFVDEQPTAYDIDKIVEQLEDVGQKMSESKSIQKYGKSSPANHRYYKAVSVKQAIGIVKGGGVMNTRKVDKSKKSNIKCEHCEAYDKDSGWCCIQEKEKNYWNRCKDFIWHHKY